MKPAPFAYSRAVGVDDAVALIGAGSRDETRKVLAGSQSLGPMLNLRLAQVDHLVDVSRIEAMCTFGVTDRMLRVGAAITHARIEDGELPDTTCGLLPYVAAGIAYRAIRNRGTLGGSLAHADPAADWVAAMHLVDAQMLVAGPRGARRLDAASFMIGPFATALERDELLVAVEIARFSPQARWGYRKACRKPGEFAEAIGAVLLDPARGIARAVIGALDSMPHVVDGADRVSLLASAAGLARTLDAIEFDDVYERELHAAMLRRAYADATAGRA